MENIIQFRIVSIKQETAEAKTFGLEPLNGKVDFLPGQFLTFILPFEHETLRRSYSIVSLPGEPIKVTVQRVENGAVSRYILIHWKAGMLLDALPPAGRFTLKAQQNFSRDIFFLAAGSGITPIFPLIRHLLQQEPQSAVHLLYSSRNEESILFRDELEKLEREHSQFHITHFLSNPKQNWEQRRRLNNGILEPLIYKKMQFEPAKAVFMICGPFTYMRMARLTLIYMKFAEEQLKTENFLPEIMRSGTRTTPHFPDRDIQLYIKGQHHQVHVKSGQNILKASLEAGIQLPYSCEGGVCSACAAICKKGKVTMSVNEVLTAKDIQDGWVLTCTGYPADDEVIIAFE